MKKKIVFVDDSQMDRMILSNVLKNYDVDFFATKTPTEFLQMVKEHTPDLCLIDLNIVHVNDGHLLVKAIRSILGDDLPIIIVSAQDEADEIDRNIAKGANDFICKPIDKAVLSTKIANFLGPSVIDTQILPVFQIPLGHNVSCRLNFDCQIEMINELGVQFSSPYLIRKGVILKLNDPFFDALFEQALEPIFKITSSWKDDEKKSTHFFGEFQDLEMNHIHSIRKYIIKLNQE